ncbi:cytochrome C oxidase subunit IV family protein [Colwellia sp. E150_009]
MPRLINNIHFSAVALILLTLISTLLAQSLMPVNLLAVLVTLSVVIKGQQIVDIFMELKNAPTKWRWFLLSYIILIPSILAIIIYI